jgi:UDPglucose 6-dehydrogenase
MVIGWIGLGKLGLPCALVMSKAEMTVIGTDTNPEIAGYISQGKIPYQEEDVEETFLAGTTIGWRDTVAEVLDEADVVFVAVQTPHEPRFEGCTPTPSERVDFDYSHLEKVIGDITANAQKPVLVVVVSTVLPGTCARIVLPLLAKNPNITFAYSPAFIAMGTTMRDFGDPEMVIVGTESESAFKTIKEVHKKIHQSPVIRLGIAECELTKVAYNTFIGMKIVFANTLGEICEKLHLDVDQVTGALLMANQRVISGKYLRAGMGDGGGCHPRDQLALSWLARELNLSIDIFEFLMVARDRQTEWLASLAIEHSANTGLPIRVCGREYKAETNLTVGSPSRLLMCFLPEGSDWQDEEPTEPAVFVIGTNHNKYLAWRWPAGSIVIDPWGYLNPASGSEWVSVGRTLAGSRQLKGLS